MSRTKQNKQDKTETLEEIFQETKELLEKPRTEPIGEVIGQINSEMTQNFSEASNNSDIGTVEKLPESTKKSLNVISIEDAKTKINDIEVVGNGNAWQLLSKASSKSQGWMKSTKAYEIPGVGCLVQVSTQQGDNVAEAIQFIGLVKIVDDENGGRKLVKM